MTGELYKIDIRRKPTTFEDPIVVVTGFDRPTDTTAEFFVISL